MNKPYIEIYYEDSKLNTKYELNKVPDNKFLKRNGQRYIGINIFIGSEMCLYKETLKKIFFGDKFKYWTSSVDPMYCKEFTEYLLRFKKEMEEKCNESRTTK